MSKTSTKAIVTDIFPLVKKSLESKSARYKKVISDYFSSRSEDIYDIGPMGRIYFGAEDVNNYFKALNIQEEQVKNTLQKTYYADIAAFNPRAAKDPFTITQLMAIRNFVVKNDSKNAELSSVYLAFSGKFYPSIHYKFFPTVQPSEYRHVMEYAINNELSQKFDLKREKSLFGAIKSICNTWLNTYRDKFKSSDDEDCVYLIQQLHNRISSFIKNIAEVYYRVYEEKDKYLTYDSDNLSDDNFHLADNDSLKCNRYIENSMNYIITKGINYKYCKMASDSNIKTNELKSILETIQEDNNNLPLIRELVTCIVIDYVNVSGDSSMRDITKFLSYTISAKPNSKDPNVTRQNEIVEKFLDENSPSYRKRKSREATKNSYKKSLIKYYSLIISQINK